MSHPPLASLDEHWQEHVKHLRQDRAKLRDENRRLQAKLQLSDQGLPPSWIKKLRKLRDENVQLRKERNAAREELAAVRVEPEARSK
jgi:ribosomal protein L19E